MLFPPIPISEHFDQVLAAPLDQFFGLICIRTTPSKICELDVPTLGDENVFWLEIAKYKSYVVYTAERGHNLTNDKLRRGMINRPVSLQ